MCLHNSTPLSFLKTNPYAKKEEKKSPKNDTSKRDLTFIQPKINKNNKTLSSLKLNTTTITKENDKS